MCPLTKAIMTRMNGGVRELFELQTERAEKKEEKKLFSKAKHFKQNPAASDYPKCTMKA